jgi:transposase
LTDVSDEKWSFVLPYLLSSRSDNASREHDLHVIFNAVRYVVKGCNRWRPMPNNLPPWPAAYQHMQC